MSIWVLCPSRGRPDKAAECLASFEATISLSHVRMSFIVDADDPTFVEYEHLPMLTYDHAGGMGNALNAGALDVAPKCDVVGFVGDDHRFRTQGWDDTITKALESIHGGVAYADDLAQRQNLATQVFISSPIIRALRWMALPGATHLYLDNAWMLLGGYMGRLIYVPQVVIEHMHPFFGKGEMDPGYERVNAPSMFDHDRLVFEEWARTQAAKDAEMAVAALG